MRIALVGYGKMGRAIEAVALRRGHEISHRIDVENAAEIASISPESTDAVVEFTQADTVLQALGELIPKRVPIVVGTTGWYSQLDRVAERVIETGGSLVYAPNFSIGVILMFRLNRLLAQWMNGQPQYDCYIEEQHHRHKMDAPSGTAIRLAQDVLELIDRKAAAVDAAALRERAPQPDELCVASIRAGDIKGVHSVTYVSEIDRLEIRHEAYSREGFALGAVIAAEWIQGRKGFFEFSEAL